MTPAGYYYCPTGIEDGAVWQVVSPSVALPAQIYAPTPYKRFCCKNIFIAFLGCNYCFLDHY